MHKLEDVIYGVFLGLVLGTIGVFPVAFNLGRWDGKQSVTIEAEKHGAGQFVRGADGGKVFQWADTIKSEKE